MIVCYYRSLNDRNSALGTVFNGICISHVYDAGFSKATVVL